MTVERKSAPPMYQRRSLIGLARFASSIAAAISCPHFDPKNISQRLAVDFPATCFRHAAGVEHRFVARQTRIQIFRRFISAEDQLLESVNRVGGAVRSRPFPPEIFLEDRQVLRLLDQ